MPAKPSPDNSSLKKAAPVGKRVTLRDVAQALGVSVATVSNAYNRPDQLSNELRERVLAQAATLGFAGPDPLASSLRRGRTGVIGVVYDTPLNFAFMDPAAAMFLGSLAELIQNHGLSLLLLSCSKGVDAIRTASVDGLIVYSGPNTPEVMQALKGRNVPTILVNQRGNINAAQVDVTHQAGAYEAARHLQDLGHRHIGVLSLEFGPDRKGGLVTPQREAGSTYHIAPARLAGYRIGADQGELYVYETEINTLQEAEKQTLDLLDAHPQVTALLCMSDAMAQGAMRAAQVLGRNIPKDLSIVGYDDVPISTTLNLTSVWQPLDEKGQCVGQMMLSLLKGEEVENAEFPTRLVTRGTTAAAKTP